MVESIKHQKKSKLYHFLRCIICRFRGDVLHPWANPLLDVSDALEFSRRWRVPAKLSQASTRVHGRLGGWHGGGALKNSLESSRRVFKGVPCSYIFHFQDWLEKEEIKFSNSFFRWKTMENLYMYNVTLRYWNTKRWLEIHSMNVRIRFFAIGQSWISIAIVDGQYPTPVDMQKDIHLFTLYNILYVFYPSRFIRFSSINNMWRISSQKKKRVHPHHIWPSSPRKKCQTGFWNLPFFGTCAVHFFF